MYDCPVVHLRLEISLKWLIVLQSYLNIYLNCSGFHTCFFFFFKSSDCLTEIFLFTSK